jgi:deltex
VGKCSSLAMRRFIVLAMRTSAPFIFYHIYADMQKKYHPHPGVRHGGAKRTAYLPETVDGHRLLKRLAYAFMHGLTFTVGVSLKTKQDNAVTWASIPHKTSLNGGQFGFPDPHYMDMCNNALDELEVPTADDL